MKYILISLLLMAWAYATIPYSIENELLFSARAADQQEYYNYAGVYVEDTPVLDPHYAWIRAQLKGLHTPLDKFVASENSHTSQVMRAIREYEAGNITSATQKIHNNIAYPVKIIEEKYYLIYRHNVGLI